MSLWAFVRTWEKDTFRWVAVAFTDCFSSDATHVLSVLGSVVAAVGGSASLVAMGPMCSPTLTESIWVVGTVTSW